MIFEKIEGPDALNAKNVSGPFFAVQILVQM